MANETGKSKCFATGCDKQIPTGMLMCAAHWFRVSPKTQSEVYKTLRGWNKGDGVGPYLKARNQANFEATGVRNEELGA